MEPPRMACTEVHIVEVSDSDVQIQQATNGFSSRRWTSRSKTRYSAPCDTEVDFLFNSFPADSYGYGSTSSSSGMSNSLYDSDSRSSISRSPYSSSYGLGSSYDSRSSYGSHSSYDPARSFMTDYRPRSGWFPKRRSGNDYPPFPSDFARGGGSGRRQSYPRAGGKSRWSFGSW